MNEKLRKHVDILFAAAPKNQRTVEMKEELLNNLNEKYDDLLRNGYDSMAAFHIALSGIGDPDELFGTSPFTKNPTQQPVSPVINSDSANAPPVYFPVFPPSRTPWLLFYFALSFVLPPVGIGFAALFAEMGWEMMGAFLMFLCWVPLSVSSSMSWRHCC